MTMAPESTVAANSSERKNFQLDANLRDYLKTNSDVVTVIRKPVSEKTRGRAVGQKRTANSVRKYHRATRISGARYSAEA